MALTAALGTAAFARYVCYSQAHCFLLTIKAVLSGRATTLDVTGPLLQALEVRLYRTPDSELPAPGAVMYLCNHRSWADFIVDSVLTNGGTYLARWAVFFGVPASCLYGWVSGSVMFFRRQRGLNRAQFVRFIATSWAHRPNKALIIYPEGTRNLQTQALKLKTGGLQAAYELRCPVQILITTNKEHVINERTLRIQSNVRLVCCYSKTLQPTDYATFESWVAAVQETWDDTWQRAYSCTAPVSFDGPFLVNTQFAAPEPAVAFRVWWLRALLVGLAAMAALRIASRFPSGKR